MKKIFLKSMTVLAAVALLSSCWDTMDDKADIDASFADASQAQKAGVALTDVTVTSYQSLDANVTVADASNVIEQGILVSKNPEFVDAIVFDGSYEVFTDFESEDDSPAALGLYEKSGSTYKLTSDTEIGSKDYFKKTMPAAFTVTAEGLDGETDYYVRAYAVTRGAGMVVSDVIDVTTPPIPFYETPDGWYTITEYALDDDNNVDPETKEEYPMIIQSDPDDETALSIINFGGWYGVGNIVVDAIYSPEDHQIYIPSGTQIGTHSKYGAVVTGGINAALTAYTSYIVIDFAQLGGLLTLDGYYRVYCSAGTFGWYTMSGIHDVETDEVKPFKSIKALSTLK